MKGIISTKLKDQLEKVLWITLAWTSISILQFLNGYNALVDLNCDLAGRDPMVFFKGSLITGIIAGVVGGSAVVFFWEEGLRTKSYGSTLFHIFLSYTLIYLVVALASGAFVISKSSGMSLNDLELWQAATENSFSGNQWHNYLVWLIIVLGTLVFMQVNDKYGPGTFLALLSGKYFRPRREQRIFMFMDLRSSTTIAEQLEEERYFNFLKDVFKHATPPILNSRGEIYQYVGDEIVISWPLPRGVLNANCIHCFFQVRKVLKEKARYYQEQYGVAPEFKAGLHYGYVMTGEIGVVKRDIAFSGDVLNTTSRIQEKCNELGVDILLSQFLVEKLTPVLSAFSPKKIGDMNLRGKEQKVMLFTV